MDSASWEERCRREARHWTLNEAFSISDPRKMRVIPEKPNRIIPMPDPNPDSVQSAKRDLAELCHARHFEQRPCEIDVLPQTANQEYGFHAQPLIEEAAPRCSREKCEMTAFADKYVRLHRSSPFAKDPDASSNA